MPAETDMHEVPSQPDSKKPREAANRLSRSAIEVVAQSLPWQIPLSESATTALALDGEYRIREIVQDSIKYMKHSKRSCLTPNDINAALRLRDVAPVYGFGGARFTKLRDREIGNSFSRNAYDGINDITGAFQTVEGTDSLFYTEDKEVSILGLLERKPRKLPIQTTISAHWLAVDSSQPTTNQNPVKLLKDSSDKKAKGPKKSSEPAGAGVDIKPLVKHDLSLELQLYFEQITGAVTGTNLQHLETSLSSIETQSGLEQMLPYLSQFVYQTITSHLQDLPVLFSTMRLAKAILANPAFNTEHYLQQLLPAICTCVVGKRLCADPWENHWALREFAAKLVSSVFEKFGKEYTALQPKFTVTLDKALSLKRPLTTHYGAIVALASLNVQTVKLYLLPKFHTFIPKLRTLSLNNAVKPIRRFEAAKVVGAMLWATRMAAGVEKPEVNQAFIAEPMKTILEELSGLEGPIKKALGDNVSPFSGKLPDQQIGEFLHNRKRLSLQGDSTNS